MLSIALTGGIGAGKSLVGEFLEELGAVVIDSDQLARQVIERGTPGFDSVVATFGDSILKDGDIDRSKLAEVVFQDESARLKLENIIHPRVRELATSIAAKVPDSGVIVNQIPLLFETSGGGRFDLVITVFSDLEIRKSRLRERGLKDYEIEKRIAAQASDEERASIADYVIPNNGSIEDLERAVSDMWAKEIRPRIAK